MFFEYVSTYYEYNIFRKTVGSTRSQYMKKCTDSLNYGNADE